MIGGTIHKIADDFGVERYVWVDDGCAPPSPEARVVSVGYFGEYLRKLRGTWTPPEDES